jgi:hypothetical protein
MRRNATRATALFETRFAIAAAGLTGRHEASHDAWMLLAVTGCNNGPNG